MNFITHFALDQKSPSSYFTVGVAIPDLLPVAGRNIRLPFKKILSAYQPQPQHQDDWLMNGIIRHYHTDIAFHESEFFRTEREAIKPYLLQIFKHNPDEKYFFLTHISVELMLDRVLLKQDSALGTAYYAHFHNVDPAHTLSILKPWTPQDINPLHKTFTLFRDRAFVLDYVINDAFFYAWQRTVQRAGITSAQSLDSNTFHAILEPYEANLSQRMHLLFTEMKSRLP